MGWNCLSIPKLQRLHHWSLAMGKYFHPTHYNGCDYLCMSGLMLIHVKRGPRIRTWTSQEHTFQQTECTLTNQLSYWWSSHVFIPTAHLSTHGFQWKSLQTFSLQGWSTHPIWPGVGVTKAPLVNFSVSRIFDFAKVHVRLFQPHSYLAGVTAAELWRHLPNINVIFNS